ncbi:transglutaminase domain-containing protein [Tenacibaculum maritimum]|uniref:transglutaminase domain-containing protein n=1 Tax=Tenacibaculum maritimum TaxID=107401 RepID=UPI003876A255
MKRILGLIILFINLAIFGQDKNYEFGKVSKQELEEKYYPSDTTAKAAYLYKNRNTYFSYTQSKGFSLTTEFSFRLKIYSEEGLKHATQIIQYYKPDKGDDEKIVAIKGYTFNLSNGKIEKEKLSRKQIFNEKKNHFYSFKKLAFPNAKIGSIIELKYKLISPYHRYIDDLQFQYEIPIRNFYAKISIPEYFKFTPLAKGFYYVQPLRSSKTDTFYWSELRKLEHLKKRQLDKYEVKFKKNISEYIATNIPALKDDEPFVNNVGNYRGGISFELKAIKFPNSAPEFFSMTWKDVSKKIHRSSRFGKELKKTAYFAKDLAPVISNSKNDLEKIISILQFIKSKVKWNQYKGKYVDKGVKKAYKEGSGNAAEINLMLVAMLREANLDANPVLISTKDNGIPLFPTLKGFNYVIAAVKTPQGFILLDATDPYSKPNILPTRTINWQGRLVHKNGGSIPINLTPLLHSSKKNTLNVKIDENLSIQGVLRSKFTNLFALNYRNKYNHLQKEEIISKLENKNNIEIEDLKISNKYNLGKPIAQLLKFSSDDMVENINGKLYVNPLLFLATTNNIFKLKERKFPIDFTTPWIEQNSTTVQIPDGYVIESLPKTLAAALPDNQGILKFQVTQDKNKIKTYSILQLNTAIISPEYYPILKEFYNKLTNKQSEKIILAKK